MRGYIRRRAQGSWTLEVSGGFDPLTGKRRRAFRTVRGSRREAEAALARLLVEITSGSDMNPSRITLHDYLQRWLEHVRNNVRARTWERYESLMRVHISPRIGHVPLAKLRATHIQEALDSALSARLAPRSVVHCYRVLGSALRQARRWELLESNPIDGVTPPRAPRPELHIPNPAELQQLLRHSETSRAHVGILLAIATGMRRGEVLGLQWRQVNLDTGRLSVTATLQRIRHADGSSALELADPKTPRSRREIALPTFAIDALRIHRKTQAERRLLLGEAWADGDLVLDRGDGHPFDPAEFSRAFQVVARTAGLPKTRLHDVRHGFATALLSRGVHPKIASEALGHSSVAFTLDTYSHVVPSMQDAAAKAIEDVIDEGSEGRRS